MLQENENPQITETSMSRMDPTDTEGVPDSPGWIGRLWLGHMSAKD